MTSPFDALLSLIETLPGPDEAASDAAGAVVEGQGRLGDFSVWLAAWQGRPRPRIDRPIAALYASAHEGSGEAEGAARRRLEALAQGDGAVSRMARATGAGVEVFDLALDRPSHDGALFPVMSDRECAATLAFGMEALAKSPDLLILSETTEGADRAAGALAHALMGGEAGEWGEDADWTALAVRRARAAGASEPMALLHQLGGREAAAIAGALVAARSQQVPVLLDGYAALAAGAVLQAIRSDALDHCLVADAGAQPGARRLAERLGKRPVVELGLERSQGLAGLSALGLMRAACALQA